MGENLNKRIKEKTLVVKFNIFCFIDHSDLDRKIVRLAKKAELKADPDKIVEVETFYSI